MALVLKINTTDRSSWIDWPSVQKVEGLTKEPDTLSFSIRKTPSKTIPALGDEVTLEEDAVKIFGGIVVGRREQIEGGILVGWDLSVKDFTHTLDRKLVAKRYENQTARAIILDIISTYTTGFTTTNVATDTPLIGSVKFNYEPVSKAIQQIADLIGWDWYVDYDKDIHFFAENTVPAPFNITDTSDNLEWGSLVFDRNILEMVNSVIVRGGEYKRAIAEGDAIDTYEAQAGQVTFPLAYKYDDIVVKKNGSSQTIGVDNITDPGTVQVLYNFTEKFVTFTSALSAGDDIVVYGDAYIPLIAQVRDQTSLTAYGEYQKVIVDKTITSLDQARTLGKARLLEWADGAYEGSFKTTTTGLKTGQYITINSTLRGVNATFKINRITGRARTPNQMEYTVQFLTSGELTFTDIMVELLGRDRKQIVISDDEVIQRFEALDEAPMTITDTVQALAKTSPPYKWDSGTTTLKWNLGTWS